MIAWQRLNTTTVRERNTRAALTAIDTWIRDAAKQIAISAAGGGGGGGGAPVGSPFVTIGNVAGLSAERALAVSSPITMSDGGANSSVMVGVNTAAPSGGYGTTALAGSAGSVLRSDARFLFPSALMSIAGSSTLTLTDAADQTLTGSLGALIITPATGNKVQINPGGPTALSMDVIVTPLATGTIGLQPLYSGQDLSSGTVRIWNIAATHAKQLISSTVVGYDMSTFSFSPTAGSDNNNVIYGSRFIGPLINNINAGYLNVATTYLQTPRRLVSNPTLIQGDTLVVEACRIGSSIQTGIYIKQTAGQQIAAERVGLLIDAQNSGTIRRSIRVADQSDLSSQTAQAQTVLNLHQLATGAVAGAHLNLDDKAGDPPSPNAGDLWRNAGALNFRKGLSTLDLALRPIPITDGGTGQINATAAFNALDPLTTKGDLVVNDGTNSVRIAVGADTQVLTADSAQAAGVKWATPGAAAALTLTEVEKDLGATAQYSGAFDITGLSGLTPGKQVLILQKAAAYTGKGDRQDESEMDQVSATGYVVDAATIRTYWVCQPHSGPMVKNVKFGYAVSA